MPSSPQPSASRLQPLSLPGTLAPVFGLVAMGALHPAMAREKETPAARHGCGDPAPGCATRR
ncbi:hypothetical protein ACMGT0_25740 [Pseudomonas sp. RHF3.3-3]|uniref:hypothetical protein n=1 Tax=Pseudomonas sp. RHF3.3-3 TaxID=3396624 RepID=UPI003A8BCF88